MIDYNILSEAVNFYQKKSYSRIEVPWMVTEDVDKVTRPSDKSPLIVGRKNKNLIASGEQGFIYMMLKGFLPSGNYQTITPCFRDESYDFTHSKTFMKCELISTIDVCEGNLHKMINHSHEFFSKYLPDVEIEKTDTDMFDLTYDDIELGSYGIRHFKHLSWIYGTGVAEPRLSRIINQSKIDGLS